MEEEKDSCSAARACTFKYSLWNDLRCRNSLHAKEEEDSWQGGGGLMLCRLNAWNGSRCRTPLLKLEEEEQEQEQEQEGSFFKAKAMNEVDAGRRRCFYSWRGRERERESETR